MGKTNLRNGIQQIINILNRLKFRIIDRRDAVLWRAARENLRERHAVGLFLEVRLWPFELSEIGFRLSLAHTSYKHETCKKTRSERTGKILKSERFIRIKLHHTDSNAIHATSYLGEKDFRP